MRISGLVLLLCMMGFYSFGLEMLENTDFSKTASGGGISSWNLLNGTRGFTENGTLTIDNKGGALVTQNFMPRPGKRIVFSVELKNENAGRVRAYVELISELAGKALYHSTGLAWRNVEAGTWVTLENEIRIPANVKVCYFAIMNEKGGKLVIRNPKVELAPDIIMRNADFSVKTRKGAAYWLYRGKAPKTVAYSANAVSFADGFLTQENLGLKQGRNYKVSFLVRGSTGGLFRSYVEWNRQNEKGKISWGGGSGIFDFKPAAAEWKKQEYTFTFPADGVFPYIVLGVKDTHAIEFKQIELKEMEIYRELGGVWNIHRHEKVKDGILLKGKLPAARLQDIPVIPGKKYAISYDAVVTDNHLTGMSPFFRIRTRIFPAGVIGAFNFTDILLKNPAQKRSHVFTVPAESGIRRITFAVSGGSDGVVQLSHFQITEVEIENSDFWDITLTRPFYRDAFFYGDDISFIKGNAYAKGADSLRLMFQGKTIELPVKENEVIFHLPFDLPEGKYELSCEFLKSGRVKKKVIKTVSRYPKAANTVTVLSGRRLTFNGKPFFPVFETLRGFSKEFLYFAARSGVNTIFMHMDEEEKLLKRLDQVHEYGMKVILYPSPPSNMAGLKYFRKKVKECITERVKAHPAMFAYHLPDEPLLAGIPVDVIRAEYQFMKEHDPYHPVWINSAPRNEIADLKPYADASDIFGVDIYPVPYPGDHSGITDKMPTACGKYARRMNRTGSFKRPVWIYLQGFAWHEAPELAGTNNIFPHPTLSESRFMAYDVLLNGGSGYFVWGTQFVRSAVFAETLRKMYTEMHRVSGLFAYGRQLPDLKTSNQGIRCAVMNLGGKRYYFLLNLTNLSQEAIVPAKGKVLLSDNAGFVNGKVKLAPFEVLVCSEYDLPEPAYRLPERDEQLEKNGNPVLRSIKEKSAFLNAPHYAGKANWIWFQGGQRGLTRCFAYKRFEIRERGEKVNLKIAGDDAYIIYLNGKMIGEGGGWDRMHSYDLDGMVHLGKNDLVILGIDGGAAPCGILAELSVGNQNYPTDTSWKVVPAYKNDKLPENFVNASDSVIVAPYGQGAWGRGVRIIKE